MRLVQFIRIIICFVLLLSPSVVSQVAQSLNKVGSIELSSYAWSELVAFEDHVFLITEDGLAIVDVSSPQRPTVVTIQPCMVGYEAKLRVIGSTLVLQASLYLQAFDITTPESPALLTTLYLPRYINTCSGPEIDWSDMAVSGNNLALLTNCGLQLFNIAAPESPEFIEQIEVYGERLELLGDTAYILSHDRLEIYDLSQPSTPVLVGRILMGAQGNSQTPAYETYEIGQVKDMYRHDGRIWASSDNGIFVFDVSIATFPVVDSVRSIPGLCCPRQLTIDSQFVYYLQDSQYGSPYTGITMLNHSSDQLAQFEWTDAWGISVSDTLIFVAGRDLQQPAQNGENLIVLTTGYVTTGSLIGNVFDAETGRPLPAASVSLSTTDSLIHSTTADQMGRFWIWNFASGEYQLSVSVNGYFTYTESASIVASSVGESNISLQAIPTTGSLQVEVRDVETNEAIEAARVVLSGTTSPVTSYTDTRGRVVFENLPAGDYSVSCSAEGYFTYQSPTVSITAGVAEELVAGLEATPIEFGTIVGSVVNERGESISEANVEVWSGGERIALVESDENGSFAVPNLVPASYAVFVDRMGYLSESIVGVSVLPGQQTQVTVTLDPALTFEWQMPTTSAVMGAGEGDRYSVFLVVTNHSSQPQQYTFRLREEAPPLPGHTQTFSPAESMWMTKPIAPGGMAVETYSISQYWNWIPHLSVQDFGWDFGLLALGEIVGQITDFSDALTLISIGRAFYTEMSAITDATFVYIGDAGDDTQEIGSVTVTVSDYKRNALHASTVCSILGSSCTTIGKRFFWTPIGGGLVLAEGVFYISKILFREAAADPPDFNFEVIVQPLPEPIPEIDTLSASVSFPLAHRSVELLSTARAFLSSIEKAAGAKMSGDSAWMAMHYAAASAYCEHAANLFDEMADDWSIILDELSGVTIEELAAAEQSLVSEGLPPVEIAILTRYGIDQSLIDALPDIIATIPEEYYLDTIVAANLFGLGANAMRFAGMSLDSLSGSKIQAEFSCLQDTLFLPLDDATGNIDFELRLSGSDATFARLSSVLLNNWLLPTNIVQLYCSADSEAFAVYRVTFDAASVISLFESELGSKLMCLSGYAASAEDSTQFSAADVVVTSQTSASLSGYVRDLHASGIGGISVDVMNLRDSTATSTVTEESGFYSLDGMANGSYLVSIATPLGYQPTLDAWRIEAFGRPLTADFVLTLVESHSACNIWWWKTYLADLREDGPRLDQFTAADLNQWGQAIYEHFYDRSDGNQIQIVEVTFVGNPAVPLQAEDFYHLLLDDHDGSYEKSVRNNMLANMLNIVSNRMHQTKVVTEDGATAGQALNYFARVYEENAGWTTLEERNKLLEAKYALRDMHMDKLIGAGIVPLSTPLVLYKPDGEEPDQPTLPTTFELYQNYPNPFNPLTEIRFALPEPTHVRLTVFNSLGQQVAILLDQSLTAGEHVKTWDATDAASGVYFYRLEAGEFVDTKKMMMVK